MTWPSGRAALSSTSRCSPSIFSSKEGGSFRLAKSENSRESSSMLSSALSTCHSISLTLSAAYNLALNAIAPRAATARRTGSPADCGAGARECASRDGCPPSPPRVQTPPQRGQTVTQRPSASSVRCARTGNSSMANPSPSLSRPRACAGAQVPVPVGRRPGRSHRKTRIIDGNHCKR